jgi:carbon-monoxide dehydrogenase medium subunit
VKPTRFAYFRPGSVGEAVACLQASDGAARLLAGGQSLIASMNRRLVRPTALVDLGWLADLRYLAYDGSVLRVGALTRHADVENVQDPEIRSAFGILPESAGLIGHLPIRTRGTFGGSIAHADPAAEWCLIAVLLGAQIEMAGAAGTRVLDAADFFTGRHRSRLRRDEVVVEVRFPHRAPNAALAEFAIQQGDFPVVAAAAAVDLDTGGRVAAARVALGGVADRPVRMAGAEQALLGGVPDARLFDHVARLAVKELDPPGDGQASGQYRKDLAAALLARALRASISRRDGAGRRDRPKAVDP